jgi:molecular chaperone GrpE
MSDEDKTVHEETIEKATSGEQDFQYDFEMDLQEMQNGVVAVQENLADHFGRATDTDSIRCVEGNHLCAESGFSEVASPSKPEAQDSLTKQMQTVLESLEVIKSAQADLAKDFSTKLKYDATKQAQIDKLYHENQGYRESVIEKFKMQLIMGVIEQIDDAEKQISFFAKQEETEKNYAKLLNCFCDVTASFQDMLMGRFDISLFRCDPGTQFDPKRQRALKTTDTSDAAQNKTVATSLRPGYEKEDGTIVRPEMVEVLRYNPALQQDMPEEEIPS